jgi:hypothetical protein
MWWWREQAKGRRTFAYSNARANGGTHSRRGMRPEPLLETAPLGLAECADGGLSGEFICASTALEVRVHLRAGRVAWATDSRYPSRFARYLQEHGSISSEQLRDVLAECRRNQLPLGATLVESGVATVEQVRAALRHQISRALSELSRIGPNQGVFLERAEGYQRYAPEFTFELSEFKTEVRSLTPAPRSDPAPAQRLLERVRRSAGDVSWLEVLAGHFVSAQEPAGAGRRVPLDVASATLLDGAALVTLRTSRGTLVGVSLQGERRSLWCRVGIDRTFGTAVSALCDAAGFAAAEPPTSGGSALGAEPWRLGSVDTALSRTLADFVARAPDLEATLVIGLPGAEAVCGVGQGGAAAEWCEDVARRRAAVFRRAESLFPASAEGAEPDLRGFRHQVRALATAESQLWCLGAELRPGSPASVWIFLKRHASQGLGWAYLTTLSRRLEALPELSTSAD